MKNILIILFCLSSNFCFSQVRILDGQYNDGQTFGKPIPDTVRTLVAVSPLSIVSGGTSLVDTLKSGGGSGTPAGSSGYIQYNNAGSFGGSSNLFWDNANGWLGIGGTPSYPLHIQTNANSTQRIRITNSNSGTVAITQYDAANDINASFQEGVTSSTFTPSGLLTANTVFFQGNSGSRLVFKAIATTNYPAPPMIFGVGNGGNTEAIRIFGNGTVAIGGNGTDSTSLLVVNGDINSIQNLAGPAQSYFTNTNTGTTSQVLFRVSNGSATGFFSIKGTGYTTNGLASASTVDIANSGGSKLLIRSIESATYPAPPIIFGINSSGNTEAWRIDWTNGNLSNTGSDGTAYINLKAGTATAGTAPFKLTPGTNLTTAEAGAMEYNGTNLFFTPGSAVRNNILMTASVNTVSPTAPNRTISVNINGVTYYIAAKTTND